MIAEQMVSIARDEAVPVFGIGPAAEMADAPAGFRPSDSISDVQSMICFGIPVPRDVFHTPAYGLETTWRSQNLLYRRLDTLALRLANLLEASGARAIPVYGCMPLGINEKGTVVGYVNQIRMAEVAGVGAIGRNGLLIHSRYGSRLMLGGLLTTAALPSIRYPDEVQPGCPAGCRICADACPVDAIMPERKQVRIMRCLRYTARTPMMSRLKFLYLRARKPKAAARYMSITAFDEHTFHVCSKCVAACPYGGPGDGSAMKLQA
jgi:epoxyqueuosine reductase QueG